MTSLINTKKLFSIFKSDNGFVFNEIDSLSISKSNFLFVPVKYFDGSSNLINWPG